MSLVRTESFDWCYLDEAALPSSEGAAELNVKHNRVFAGYAGFVGTHTNGGGGRSFRVMQSGAPTVPHGACLMIGTNYLGLGGTAELDYVLESTEEDSTIFHGFRFNWISGSNFQFLYYRESRIVSGAVSSCDHAGIKRNASGTYDVLNAVGTVIGTFSITDGVWSYVEVKIVVHASAGQVVVRVNGVVVLNLTGQNTRNSASFSTGKLNVIVHYGNYSSSFTWRIDDEYILNSSGSRNNDFLGDVTVSALKPSAAGTYTNWAPSAGSNWDTVSDNPLNSAAQVSIDTTDYVTSFTLDQKDSYTIPDVTIAAGYIPTGVVIYAFAQKQDTGVRNLAVLARNSSTDQQSIDRPVAYVGDPVNDTCHTLAMDTSVGGTAWTQALINSLEIGIVCR